MAKKMKRTMALLLALVMLFACHPALGLSAQAAGGEVVTDQVRLRELYDSLPDGGTILIGSELKLSETFVFNRKISCKIVAAGTNAVITNNGPNWTDSAIVAGDGLNNTLFRVETGKLTVGKGVELYPEKKGRSIHVISSVASLVLDGCIIRGGELKQSQGGAGVSAYGAASVDIRGGTVFWGNNCETTSMCGGGALYASGTPVTIDDALFYNNTAHSGGAIYLYAEKMTCTENTYFVGNSAGQRGGAIHNHGVVSLNGTKIDGLTTIPDRYNSITPGPNISEQYGGGVYVSADGVNNGKLILDGAVIQNNQAANSGGGIYIADKGEVYIGGSTAVQENRLPDDSATPSNFLINNIFVSTANSRVITYKELTGLPGSIGISTANPYWPKIVAYSTATVTDVELPDGIVANYTMPNAKLEAGKKVSNDPIKYDSSVWYVKDLGQDPTAPTAGKNDKCVIGNRWLNINPDYYPVPGPPSGDSPRVIFDYNLPGAAATVYPDASTIPSIKEGDSIPAPILNNTSVGNVDFKFLGWFDAPSGGNKCGTNVTVQSGTRVYYAQWDVSTDPGPGPSPTPGDLFTVFWNMNYTGGGVTSSLVGTFKLSTTVTVSASSSSMGGSLNATATETQTKDVTIAFSVPRAPIRKGYIFGGWATSPTATSGTTTPATPSSSTTFYAVWTAQPYTLTWNGNGGTPATSSSAVKYDDPITPPAAKPTRAGYTFTGWYSDAACTVPLVSGTTVTGHQTFYAGWSAGEYEIVWSANYTGGGMTTVQQHHDEGLRLPAQPVREGFTFQGWYTAATGGSKVSSSTKVTGDATYYAHWSVDTYTIKWDPNTGKGGGTTQVDHGEVIDPPAASPTKTGYTFTGWYSDKGCTTPFVNGTVATKDQTFYAGWTPNEHTIQWDANYTGGGNTSIKQHYDEELVIPPDPTRVGFVFGGWYTQPNGAGTRAEAYGTVTKDEIFYANWVREAQSYTVNIDWADHSDNDLVRPGSVRVSLMANDLPTGMSYLFTQADADASGNLWSHTFTGLPITDVISQPITYSVAITSPVSDEYTYGIENKSATLGYILMTHTLITTDINSYVVWADHSNNDGYRPSTVSLQLYANGEKINDAEGRVALSGSGDTWTYSFKDFQKFYTDADGNKRQEIKYTLVATATNPGELGQYTIAYNDYTVTLTHAKDTISKTVGVEWNDSNNKDGKRPASMVVQLYADNVPVQGKYVTLSDANRWSHTWNDLPKLTAAGRKVVYSAQVTSTLVDYTAKSTEMTIEMTYVPSSTSISAFALWTDQNDADGLRPDFVTAELVADGKPTGDKQVLAAVNGWTTSWKNYPMYKNGNRIEYTFRIDPMPDGYRADYAGVYDTSGLSVTLTHDRELTDQTAKIVWNDRNNVSGDRMDKVCVQLYADGAPIEDTQVWVTETDGWQHTYKNLPAYKNGGELIRYSVYLFSSAGKYQSATEGMTITLNLDVERVDIPLKVIWNDNNNANGLRPLYVGVQLLIDDELSKYQLTATEENGWSTTFTGMVRFGYTPDGDGHAFKFTARVIVPTGYEVEYIADTAVLSMAAATADYPATVIWNDNDNQYGVRPAALNLHLWADYQDGNGAVQTGKSVSATAADGWTATFSGLPVYKEGKMVLYSVRVAENASYISSYDGMTVTMTHKDTPAESGKSDFPVTLIWTDNKNANGSRPASVDVTLSANGVEVQTYTATENDVSGAYTWGHTFTALPTYQGGAKVKYTVSASVVPNYTARVQGNSIIFTHVQDIAIKLYWDDNGNVSGTRPSALNLNLYADNREIGVSKSVTGTGGVWSCVFENVPVWSTVNTTKAAAYTWLPDANEITALEHDGYSMDYHGYELVGTPAAYRVDLSRNVEVADYAATINWSDGTDRDGKRPAELPIKLYADYGDGKGAVDTGKTAKVEGGNEDAAWRYTFSGLSVWANQGKRVVYTLRADAPKGYEVAHSDDALTLTVTHAPERVEVIANVVWDDATNVGGLTRFGLTAELVVDGSPNRELADLNQSNGYTETWGQKYVYHDHGKAYQYGFHFAAADLPTDYEISTDGWTATVRRVRFNIGGTITDKLGNPVIGADVTLYDSDKQAIMNTETAADGRYTFSGLTVGAYTVRATKTMNGKTVGTADISITNSDLNATNIQLMPDSGGGDLEYTYTLSGMVKDSNGLPAAGAKVSVFTASKELVGSATTYATGRYLVTKLPNGTYQLAVVYTLNGVDYTTAGQAVTIYNADKTAQDITVKVPEPEQPTDKPCVVSGKVTNELGKALADIMVVVYGADDTRYTAVISDEMGGYKLTGVPDGKYKFLYYYAGTAVVTKEITVSGEKEQTVPTVSIDTTARSGLGTLAGVAVDAHGKPVEGAEVYVYTKSGEQVGFQKTGKNGAYRFDLPVGEYLLEIRKPFDNTTDSTVDVNDGAVEGGSVTADTFTIAGTVLDGEGKGVEGTTVYLYGAEVVSSFDALDALYFDGFITMPPALREMLENVSPDVDQVNETPEPPIMAADIAEQGDAATQPMGGAFVRLMETVTDAEGNYAFCELPAGEYVVKIAHGIGGNGESTDIPVTAGPNSTTPEGSNVTVTTESYTVSGVVKDKSGNPIEGAVVTIHDSEGNEVGEVITGADGLYVFPGLSKEIYTLTISYPDFEILGGGKVEIEEGGTVVFQGHAVSGAVKDDKGNPIKGAVIALTNSETAAEYLTATDKDGKFRVAVPKGTYSIKATYDGKDTSGTATVKDADVTGITLTIKLSTGGGDNPGGNPGGDTGGGSGSGGTGGGGSGGGTGGGGSGGGTSGGGGTGGGSNGGGSGGVQGRQVKAYIKGLPDGTFGAGRNITRAEVAAILSRVADGFDPTAPYKSDYVDVAEDAWYQANVGFCAAKGLMNGRGEGAFAPDASITRAEFAAVVARLLGLPNIKGKASFPDIPGTWAEGYISQLTDKGIITGLPGGTFAPDALITRAEVVTIVNRALTREPDKDGLAALVKAGKAGYEDMTAAHWAYYQVIEASVDHTHK